MVKEMEKEIEESESLLKSQVKDVKERRSEQQRKIIGLEAIVEKQEELKERGRIREGRDKEERGREGGRVGGREGGREEANTTYTCTIVKSSIKYSRCTLYLLPFRNVKNCCQIIRKWLSYSQAHKVTVIMLLPSLRDLLTRITS